MATITSTSTRITISGTYKAFTGGSGNTTTVIQFSSGNAPATGDAGRFLMWKNGSATKDWEIRYIESATSTTVTVGDGGFSSAPASSEDFVISTNLADIETAVSACTVAGKSYSFNGRDWGLTSGAFLADVDVSIDTEQSVNTGGYNAWNAANGCAVQFGRLTGGEANGSTITRQGCYISLNSSKPSANSKVFGSGGSEVSNGPIYNFYGCYIKNYTPTAAAWAFMRGTGPVRMIGSIWDGPIGGAFYHSASELVDTKFRGNTNLTPAWSIRATFTRAVSNAQFANGLAAFKTFQNFVGVFRDTVFDLDSLDTVLFLSGQSAGLTTLVDCTTFGDANITDSGSGTVLQGKSVNYTVTDAAGTGLSGVKVAIYDTDGTIQDALRTSSSGAVSEIVTIFNQYVNSAPSLSKAPFDIRIRRYGYVYLGFQSSVAEPVKQEVRLAVNSRLASTEAQAAAISGIALNFSTETVTITSNQTSQSLYDYYQYQLYQTSNMAYGEDLILSGTAFDLSDWDIVVDGATYTGDITTTGAITLPNSGLIVGTSTDSVGTTTVSTLTLTGLQSNSEVRVFNAGTTTELAGVENSGTTFTANISASSVDIVVHSLGYEYQKIEGADTSSNLTLPIQQRVDRNYRNP